MWPPNCKRDISHKKVKQPKMANKMRSTDKRHPTPKRHFRINNNNNNNNKNLQLDESWAKTIYMARLTEVYCNVKLATRWALAKTIYMVLSTEGYCNVKLATRWALGQDYLYDSID